MHPGAALSRTCWVKVLVEPKFCSAGQPLPGLLIGQLGQPARAGSGGLLTPSSF